MTLPANQSESDQWLSSISAPLTGDTPIMAAKQMQAAQSKAVGTTVSPSSTPAGTDGPLAGPFAASNIAKKEGSSADIAVSPGAPHLTAAAAAANKFVDTETARVAAWTKSGLNGKLSSLIKSGDYAGAFAAAAKAGQFQAMITPLNLKSIVPGGTMTKAQFQQYYQAFAPYQAKLKGTSMSAEGFADTVWNSYSPAEAIENWQAAQQPSGADALLGGTFQDLPNPEMFGHSNQPSDLQMTALVVGMGLAAVVPALAPEVAAALGTSEVAGGVIAGGVAGAATGYGETGTAAGALKGAVAGGVGGGLAAGGAQAISGETGIPAPIVSAGAKTAVNDAIQTFGTSQQPSTNIPASLAMPGATAAGATMANPTNPATPQNLGQASTGLQIGGYGAGGTSLSALAAPATSPSTDPSATAPTTTATDPSFLSTIGGDITSFLNSPMGNVAEFGTLAGLGLEQANAQKSENQALAGTIATTGQPYTQAGAAELSQLEGGPSMGGPMGASIDQQTAAAKNLGQVAQDYSTGKLTAAQQSQVDRYVAEQKSVAQSELAAAGITDPNSSQYQSRMQQIEDNATQLSQSLVTSNTSLAESALNSVQATYSGLLNQALTSSEFGLGAQESAVTLQIQSDTALANQLQTLFSGIAQGFGNAMRPSGGGGGGGGSAPGTTPGGVASKAAGGAADSGVASSAAGGGATPSQLRQAGGSESGIAAGGPSATDQAIYDANNQSFVDQTDQTIAGDTSAQDALNQYADQYTPPDITGGDPFSADIPSYTSDPSFLGDVTSDPFGGLGP